MSEGADVQDTFVALLDKSFSLFAGLRDLPPFGQRYLPYFQKTFEVYTRLWKFQQQNRAALESSFGLRRSEVGDIASHIGQLYYHYYLRTSNRAYLHESAVFYDAIQQRRYFEDFTRSSTVDDWRRLLRYYARFIVVCLLQRRHDKVQALAADLGQWVTHYITHLSPPDAQEWLAVMRELQSFLAAVRSASSLSMVLPGDLEAVASPPTSTAVALQQCVLVASQSNQIKVSLQCFFFVFDLLYFLVGGQLTLFSPQFSEITLDSLRVMGALEREPSVVTASAVPAHVAAATTESDRSALSGSAVNMVGLRAASTQSSAFRNPTKHLLYRPTLATTLAHVHGALRELTGNGALLLYLSTDSHGTAESPWSGGALLCTHTSSGSARVPRAELHTLCPGDIASMTRRPLMLVCESDDAALFGCVQSPFAMPFVALLAPSKYPAGMDRGRIVVSPPFAADRARAAADDDSSTVASFGNLFTLFLTDPLTAIVRLCGASSAQWSEKRAVRAKAALVDCLQHTLRQLREPRMAEEAPDWAAFAFDDCAALFIAKYALCRVVLARCQRVPNKPEYAPTCTPPLPADVDPPLVLLETLAKKLQVTSSFA